MTVTFNNLPNAIEQIMLDMQTIKSLLENLEVSKKGDQIFNIKEAGEFLNLQRQTLYQNVHERKKARL